MIYFEPSALVAILLEEPERDQFLAKVAHADRAVISVIGMVEATLSVGKAIQDYSAASAMVAGAVKRMGVNVVDVPANVYDDVITCYSRYGRGTGHGARLNFGDCFSYVMAKRLADGFMLFKGGDFLKTDIVPA